MAGWPWSPSIASHMWWGCFRRENIDWIHWLDNLWDKHHSHSNTTAFHCLRQRSMSDHSTNRDTYLWACLQPLLIIERIRFTYLASEDDKWGRKPQFVRRTSQEFVLLISRQRFVYSFWQLPLNRFESVQFIFSLYWSEEKVNRHLPAADEILECTSEICLVIRFDNLIRFGWLSWPFCSISGCVYL